MARCEFDPRTLRGVLGIFLFLTAAVSSGGCLSLGGRTTYVQESPETVRRIEVLEGRVGAIEQIIHPPQ